MLRPSRLSRALALGAVLALGGCGATTGPSGERRAELLRAIVPATAAPDQPFVVTAVFGRGPCDYPRAHVDRNPADVRIGMRVTPEPPPNGGTCQAMLRRDSLDVLVVPPFTLPFTVRLEDAVGDSVVVVRERAAPAAAAAAAR